MSKQPLTDDVLDQLFREARSYSSWSSQPVDDEQLQALYELMKWGPTAVNRLWLASSLCSSSASRVSSWAIASRSDFSLFSAMVRQVSTSP